MAASLKIATTLKPGHGLSDVLGKAVRLYKGKQVNILQNVGYFERVDTDLPLNSVYNQAALANKKAMEDLSATYETIERTLTPEFFRNTFKVEGVTVENGNEDLLYKEPPFDIFRKHSSNPNFVNLVEKLYRGYKKTAETYEAKQREQGKKLLEDVERVAVDMFETVTALNKPILELYDTIERDVEHYKRYQDLLPSLTGQQILALFPRLASEIQDKWENDEWLLTYDVEEEESEYYKVDVSPSFYVPGTGGGAH